MVEVHWAPQPGPQTMFLQCPYGDIFFGGARGGGKTEASLGHWYAHHDRWGGESRGIFFRHSGPQLEEPIARAKAIFTPEMGWNWAEKKQQLTHEDGAVLKFRHLDDPNDAQLYQGHEYTWQCFEELTNWSSSDAVDKLIASLRNSKGVKCVRIATGNPGGPGHGWVKSRYIDPAPPMTPIREKLPNGSHIERVFIPSRVQDNKILLKADPGYIDRLYQAGDEQLVRAWLEGDWTVTLGQFFTEWNPARHVIADAEIPKSWTRFTSLDWGSNTPFCVGWYAVADGVEPVGTMVPPQGALIKYREWYGSRGNNQGLKLTGAEVARGILARENGERIAYRTCDYQVFRVDNGPSAGEDMQNAGVYMQAGDKSRAPGWLQVRSRLQGKRHGHADWQPMLYVMRSCTATIQQVQALQYNPKNAEDVISGGEDHAADETRYAAMSRPYMRASRAAQAKPRMTLNALLMNQPTESRSRGY